MLSSESSFMSYLSRKQSKTIFMEKKKNFSEVIGPIFLKNIKSIVDNICSEG